MTTQQILVLGGTGRTGGRIVRLLRDRGVSTRVASRASSQPFDWHDPATWDAALSGCTAAYLCYSPDLAFPGVAELMARFATRADVLGVRRLVLLSGRGEEGALASERAVMDVAEEATVVRSSWFAQNFSENFLLGPVLRGRLVLPAGDVAEPFVDLDDLAAIAATALVDDGHAGAVYDLTGPELLSMHDVAAELSRATGRTIEYTPSSAEQFVRDVALDGVPREEAEPLAELFETVLDGRNASLTTTVQTVLGRPATTFSEYARRAAATGVWGAR